MKMHKINGLLIALLVLGSTSLWANPYNNSKGGDKTYNSSESNSGVYGSGNAKVSQGQANIQKGNDVSVIDNQVRQYKISPNVSLAGLVASSGSCLGSASGGASGNGIGISFGSTKSDIDCNVRLNSAALLASGHVEASQHIHCLSPLSKQALEATGYDCGDANQNSQVVAPKTTFTNHSGSGFLGR